MTLRGSASARQRGDRMLATLALTLGVLSFVLAAAGAVYAYRNTRLVEGKIDWASGPLWQLWPLAVVVVGVVVAVARPQIFVGWGLLIAGFAIQVGVFGGAYAGWGRLSGSPAPLSGLAIWLALVANGVTAAMVPQVVTRLPSGRLDNRMTRITSRVSWVLGGALVAWWAFGNEVLSINSLSEGVNSPGLPNPLALLHPSRSVTSLVTSSLTLSLLVCWVISIVLVLGRRRRASVVERAQLRWLGFGLLALPVVIGLSAVVHLIASSLAPLADSILLVLGLGAVPASIAISVLKFRLFDIDRLVSRTVVFGVVALVLGVVYAALTVLPYMLIVGAGSDDAPSWLVAASTLGTAALFSPLRRRVQRVVDRRFNRSRYDGEQVIERFSAQVRESTDLRAITSGLSFAVRNALQPARVAVWLSDPRRNDPVTPP